MSIILTIQPYDDMQNYLDILGANGGGILNLNPTAVYYPTNDIFIPNNVTLNGNYGTIDFNNQPYSLNAIGTNVYDVGTVSITNGSTNIVGTGTSWDATMVGQTIFFEGNYFTITGVVDSTNIVIDSTYAGSDVVNSTYSIADSLNYLNILNVNIRNSTSNGLVLKYVTYTSLDSVNIFNCSGVGLNFDWTVSVGLIGTGGVIDGNGTNIKYENSSGFTIDNSTISNSTTGHNIELINSGDAVIRDSAITGAALSGMSMTNVSNMATDSSTISDNTVDGIVMVSGNSKNQFYGIVIENNTGYGMNIEDSTSEKNIISINNFDNNTLGNMNDLGTDNSIKSNIGVADN